MKKLKVIRLPYLLNFWVSKGYEPSDHEYKAIWLHVGLFGKRSECSYRPYYKYIVSVLLRKIKHD